MCSFEVRGPGYKAPDIGTPTEVADRPTLDQDRIWRRDNKQSLTCRHSTSCFRRTTKRSDDGIRLILCKQLTDIETMWTSNRWQNQTAGNVVLLHGINIPAAKNLWQIDVQYTTSADLWEMDKRCVACYTRLSFFRCLRMQQQSSDYGQCVNIKLYSRTECFELRSWRHQNRNVLWTILISFQGIFVSCQVSWASCSLRVNSELPVLWTA